MRLTPSNKETKLAELAQLDSKVRSFLEVLLGELEWRQTLICVLVALCLRLLFLLYWSVLDTLQYSKSETEHQTTDLSWIGLDMMCRTILDVEQWHGEEKAPIIPICSSHILRAARKRIQERNKHVVDEALSRDIDSLLGAGMEYRKT